MTKTTPTRDPFIMGNMIIEPGERAQVFLPLPNLYTHNQITWPVFVIHGKEPGPVIFISAAIHGDELNGVEIIRRITNSSHLKRIKGTLIAVPFVNVLGVINQTRYLPDRRDLNRSFPGSANGSLAGRFAHLFLSEIVSRCTHGIDLHTAAIHRDNLPQIRAFVDDPETYRMARAFGAPVIVNTGISDGSLRRAAEKLNIPVIVYEAGEALRFNEIAIRAGFRGVVAVLRELEMLPKLKTQKPRPEPFVALSASWVRAPKSGILRSIQTLGQKVEIGQSLAIISDPFGKEEQVIHAEKEGIIIGRALIPMVNEGEAVFNIASFKNTRNVLVQLQEFQDDLDPATDDEPATEPTIV